MAKAGDKKVKYISNTYDAQIDDVVTVDGETAERLVANNHAVLVAEKAAESK